VDLSGTEIVALEKASGLPRKSFTNTKDQEAGEFFIQFQKNGYCLFLIENNGSFSCSVYEARPDVCRSYPSNPTQKALCETNLANFLNR
jgi:Fe-S-cluster containining protein